MTRIIKERYQLLNKLGQGGFGAVYRAFDQMLNREVAIKVLKVNSENQEEIVKRFQVESQLVSRLEHPNILRVYDFGKDEAGRCFLVTELLKGESLHALLKPKAPLELNLALDILYQVGLALEVAHAQKTVHRDIKPPNIFLNQPMRGANFVKLLDFGIAKVVGGDQEPEQSLTVTGQIMGTPHYMSPEQIVNIKLVDHRSDIYSLGIVLYQMLIGCVPFDDESYFSVMKKQMQTPMPPLMLPHLPGALAHELQEIVSAMTHKDVRRRVTEISEILQRVREIWARYPQVISPRTTGGFNAFTEEVIESLTAPKTSSQLESINQMLEPFQGGDAIIDQMFDSGSARSDAPQHTPIKLAVSSPADPLETSSQVVQPQSSQSQSAQPLHQTNHRAAREHRALDSRSDLIDHERRDGADQADASSSASEEFVSTPHKKVGLVPTTSPLPETELDLSQSPPRVKSVSEGAHHVASRDQGVILAPDATLTPEPTLDAEQLGLSPSGHEALRQSGDAELGQYGAERRIESEAEHAQNAASSLDRQLSPLPNDMDTVIETRFMEQQARRERPLSWLVQFGLLFVIAVAIAFVAQKWMNQPQPDLDQRRDPLTLTAQHAAQRVTQGGAQHTQDRAQDNTQLLLNRSVSAAQVSSSRLSVSGQGVADQGATGQGIIDRGATDLGTADPSATQRGAGQESIDQGAHNQKEADQGVADQKSIDQGVPEERADESTQRSTQRSASARDSRTTRVNQRRRASKPKSPKSTKSTKSSSPSRRRRAKLSGSVKLKPGGIIYEPRQIVRLSFPKVSIKTSKLEIKLGRCATWVSRSKLIVKLKLPKGNQQCVIKACYAKRCIRSSKFTVIADPTGDL